jgi:hypothetical protein
MPRPTPATRPEPRSTRTGSIITTTTDPTPGSEAPSPQIVFTTSRGRTPSRYLVSSDAWVDRADQIHVDPDMYVLADGRVQRYRFGRLDGSFVLRASTPANGVETDYRLMAGSRDSSSKGRLYLYDAANRVVVGFDKENARPVGSWTPAIGSPELGDVRGMVIVGAKHRRLPGTPEPDSLVWITPEGLFAAELADFGERPSRSSPTQ